MGGSSPRCRKITVPLQQLSACSFPSQIPSSRPLPLPGPLLVSAADATQMHQMILLVVYIVAWLGRSMMAFFAGFGVQLALALVTEGASAPLGALVDSAVMASQADDGGYGRIRWGARLGMAMTGSASCLRLPTGARHRPRLPPLPPHTCAARWSPVSANTVGLCRKFRCG